MRPTLSITMANGKRIVVFGTDGGSDDWIDEAKFKVISESQIDSETAGKVQQLQV